LEVIQNKLTHVNDSVDPNLFGNSLDGYKVRDIDNQPNNNYEYDEIGQLISDQSEGIEKIEWRVDGKVKSILKQGETHPLIFYYDGLGNRVVKNAKDAGLGQVTHYARDAQGNVLATYRVDKSKLYTLEEHHIFGSSRLGMQTYIEYTEPENPHRLVGDKRYELSNHLGNVLSVINDRKIVPSDA
jgi:hypothetical protein